MHSEFASPREQPPTLILTRSLLERFGENSLLGAIINLIGFQNIGEYIEKKKVIYITFEDETGDYLPIKMTQLACLMEDVQALLKKGFNIIITG